MTRQISLMITMAAGLGCDVEGPGDLDTGHQAVEAPAVPTTPACGQIEPYDVVPHQFTVHLANAVEVRYELVVSLKPICLGSLPEIEEVLGTPLPTFAPDGGSIPAIVPGTPLPTHESAGGKD